ncbi:MAG TPA: carboxymuconolactone decarboxylase family protein [Stellaceae bacterium]|jgi:4-carboxymuconolactone decarboxylase|nr:carboxymuconolactone decarboxylase family protein [Stellaceae bacterium]
MKKIVAGALAPVIAVAMIAFTGASVSAQTPQAAASAYPPDVDKQSGFRLPVPKREDLDAAGKKTYDAATSGSSIAGLQGPSGIQLYSPEASQHIQALVRYFRKDSGIPPKVREIAILSAARAMSNKFEWAAHEPVARKAGVSEATIDAIKNRGPISGLPATDALIIKLARETFDDHHVTPETFAAAKKAFGSKQLVDITLLMGDYSMTAALLTVFDMQLRPGEVSDLPMP